VAQRPIEGVAAEIVDAAFRLHCSLGPGLLESVYETILARDLERRGLQLARQMSVSCEYDGLLFTDICRVDLLVEEQVVVEIKSVERLAPVHPKQLLTYLRLLKLPLGLLINFGAPTLKEGLHRIVNGLKATEPSSLRINRPSASKD
jgi:GxxExxY protein